MQYPGKSSVPVRALRDLERVILSFTIRHTVDGVMLTRERFSESILPQHNSRITKHGVRDSSPAASTNHLL